MRNIYLGSLFKFDGGICGKLYLKNAFYSPSKWCFQIHWKWFRFEITRFKITNVRTCIAKRAAIGILNPKRPFLFLKCGAKRTLKHYQCLWILKNKKE